MNCMHEVCDINEYITVFSQRVSVMYKRKLLQEQRYDPGGWDNLDLHGQLWVEKSLNLSRIWSGKWDNAVIVIYVPAQLWQQD